MTTPITPADARFLADEIALQGSTGIARKVRSLADQVESLTKERDKLKEAAKLANAFIEWTAYGNCRADEGPIPTASEVSTALRRAGVQ